MSDKLWIPSQYVDEVCPAGRAHPTDWIVCHADGRPRLDQAFADDEPEDDDGDALGTVLSDGDVIEFDWTQSCGEGEAIVAEDGAISLSFEAKAPAGACLRFWFPGDPDSNVGSPSEWQDLGMEVNTGDCVEVFAWCDEAVAFRFDAATRTFVAAEATPA